MSSRTLVFALFFAHVVSALNVGRLGKRDAPFIPQRVDIPLSFDSQGRYVATVTMGTNQQQHFNFTMTTQTGLTYVAGTRCSSCGGVPLYNQSLSPSAQSLSSASSAPILGESASATIIKEDCRLRLTNGSGWDYPNQTIVVTQQPVQGQLAAATNAQVGDGLAGLIGLATNKNSPTSANSSEYTPQFGDSIFGQWLSLHPTASNFTFGMQLGSPLNVPRGNTSQKSVITPQGDPGMLHWLQPDTSAYDPAKVVWMNAGQAPSNVSSNSSGDWYVSIDGWVLRAGNNQVSNSKTVVATVDPLYTDLYLPQDQASLIHDAIPGAQLRQDLSSLPGVAQAWTIPCNSTFSYGIVIGSETFTLDESILVLPQPDGSCVSSIEAWIDTTDTQYVFGARFLSTIYLIFNIPRDGSNSMGFAPRTLVVKKSSHVGAIVGGTIGGVAFLVITALAVYYFVYRHRSDSYRVTAAQYDAGHEFEKPDEDSTIRPFTLSVATPTTAQFARAPESTVGSDHPGSTVVSPTSAGPMLGIHNHADNDFDPDVAPPSYETVSEVDRRGSQRESRPLPLPSARDEKAALAARLSTGSNAGYASASGVPPSPTDAGVGSSGTSSVHE